MTEEEAQGFFKMIQSSNLEAVNLAFDMLIDSGLMLPYRYNEVGGGTLRSALSKVPYDTYTWKGNLYKKVPWRSDALQRKINLIRERHTLPWDWRQVK